MWGATWWFDISVVRCYIYYEENISSIMIYVGIYIILDDILIYMYANKNKTKSHKRSTFIFTCPDILFLK